MDRRRPLPGDAVGRCLDRRRAERQAPARPGLDQPRRLSRDPPERAVRDRERAAHAAVRRRHGAAAQHRGAARARTLRHRWRALALLELARTFGQPAGPAPLLADAGQADGAALLAPEARAGDAPVAQAGGAAVDRLAMPAVGTGDLD